MRFNQNDVTNTRYEFLENINHKDVAIIRQRGLKNEI